LVIGHRYELAAVYQRQRTNDKGQRTNALQGETMRSINLNSAVLPLVITAMALPANAQQAQQFVKYQCNDGKTFEVQYFPDKAWMRLDNLRFELLPVEAVEGMKYSNGRTLLQTIGNKASIDVNFQPYLTECISQKDVAPFPNPNPFLP
jgi:membrane-bound inhibitor of C-type lysozyme